MEARSRARTTAPASSASSRISAICAGSSLIPGISGATRIPVLIPARLSSATASSRARGFGVCGSVARHARSSIVGTDSAAVKSVTRVELTHQIQITQQQRRLGQHRRRVARRDHRLPDPSHQLVAALDPLIRVGVGPQRDVLALPRRPRQLGPQPLRRVDLDDDLTLEISAGIEVQVRVRRPREAVNTSVACIRGTG